jgi:hypothetical protein
MILVSGGYRDMDRAEKVDYGANGAVILGVRGSLAV